MRNSLISKIALLLAFSLGLGLSTAKAEESSHHSALVMQAYNQGVKEFNAGQFEGAVPYFDQAIEHDGNFEDAFYARAACKHSLRNPEGALSDLNEAIRINSDYLEAHSLRAVVYYEAEQWDPALEDFNFVLHRRPTDAQSLLGRGVLSLKKNQLKTTQHDFRLFLQLRPQDPLAPKLRKLLTSLSKDSQGATSGAEDDTSNAASEPSSTGQAHARRLSATSEKLADELFMSSHQISDSFTRKVLRGERAEAVGDLHSMQPSAPPDAPSGQGVQIIEPQ